MNKKTHGKYNSQKILEYSCYLYFFDDDKKII